ncbi:MAG: site-specific DNA-methyltransferase [Bacillota bacterium]|nr:site-specific DNA-methyltransferase [Bacillota bacterium]
MALLYKGDNLKVLKKIEGQIDFIYIDPPFFSKADYGNYDDRWKNLDEFLKFLEPRLELMKEKLSDTGLIAVHLDWHAVHYVKVMMDKIFGYDNFVNEIIWAYKSGGASPRSFAKKHDTILLYGKTKDYYFSPQKEKSYNREGRPYRFKGVEEFEDEYGWYTLVNRKDVLNIDMVGRTSGERTGYATQKPEALLEILIESCCPKGGLVADFFAGSGTTGAAAYKTGRDFILCDEQDSSIEIIKERLDKLGAKYEITYCK